MSQPKPLTAAPQTVYQASDQQTLAKPQRLRLTDEQLRGGLAAMRACWLPTRGA
ncbi:hypothetical protein [Lentzea sp. NBRC 102530]|uniref:hypothetical protein n=1 Tax=Lentzea sp. NBRC 102530 TaxID=3032201 RepID=UPI002553FB17|nr:hypothetical protein [Lentzea sp. NBRC 102530]